MEFPPRSFFSSLSLKLPRADGRERSVVEDFEEIRRSRERGVHKIYSLWVISVIHGFTYNVFVRSGGTSAS